MIESPKIRFQLNAADVEMLTKLSKNDAFLRAIDAALAQIIWEGEVQSVDLAAHGSYHRMCGARDFVIALFNLTHIPPPPPKPLNPSNLNWNA